MIMGQFNEPLVELDSEPLVELDIEPLVELKSEPLVELERNKLLTSRTMWESLCSSEKPDKWSCDYKKFNLSFYWTGPMFYLIISFLLNWPYVLFCNFLTFSQSLSWRNTILKLIKTIKSGSLRSFKFTMIWICDPSKWIPYQITNQK